MSIKRVAERPRMVMLTNVLPVDSADNAGQVYVTAQIDHWRKSWDVRCLLIDGRSARTEFDRSHVPFTRIASSPSPRRRIARFWDRMLRWSPSSWSRVVRHDLLSDPRARDELRQADAIVLQWEHVAALAGAIRRIAPKAKIVGVLHDVVSQGTQRRQATAAGLVQRLKLALATVIARRTEHRLGDLNDHLIVLSSKDLALLPPRTRAKAAVVPAPATFTSGGGREPIPGRAVLVINWRPENLDALAWLVDEVWPYLADASITPDVHMIGRGLEGPAVDRARELGFTDRGFVEDLSAEYSSAAVALVPLQLGAGVKFKTVEALAHGVPLVTTNIGAEGISSLDGDRNVTDDARQFAQRIVEILEDPEGAEAHARELRASAAAAHSYEALGRALDDLLPPMRDAS